MMRRWVRGLLGVVVLALIGAAAFLWMRRPVEVEVVDVRYAPLVRTLQFAARVEALSRVDVGSTVTGRVEQVLVREGASVREGALLVQLETAEARAALAQALASQAQAQARLAGLRSTGRGTVQAAVAQARAALDAAQSEFERTRQLVAQGFVSASRQDESRRARDVAAAQLDSAQTQARAIGEAGTEVAQAQAQLTQARAGIDAARARLAQTALRAPADALVLARSVEPGQIVQPGKALLTLALDGPTRLSAQVDERFLDQLALEQPASVLADAYPGRRFAARVLSISPAVDPQRGAVEVQFTLQGEAPAFLREDMTLSIEVETGRRARALVLPIAALVRTPDANIARVRVIEDGRIDERDVRLGLRTLGAAEIRLGLAEGDEVVLDTRLPLGKRVRARVVEPDLDGASAVAGAGSGAAQLTNMMGR
jgi:HlyD family secretion protein